MPKKLSLLKHVDLKQAIAEIITNPNKNWKKLKREKYMTEKPYFQIQSPFITIYLKPSGPTDCFVIPT
jgi:hypothetical protein